MPLPGYNAAYTVNDPLNSAEFRNRLIVSANERFFSRGAQATLAIPLIVNGYGNGDATSPADILAIQQACEDYVGFFAAPVVYDGMAGTLATVELAAPLTWADVMANVPSMANDWPRVIERRLAGTSAPAYENAEAGAIADGHKARDITTGTVHRRVAGAWVELGDDLPDKLWAYGKVQPYDLQGPWVFNAIRDVLNYLHVYLIDFVVVDNAQWDGFHRDGTGTVDPTYAAAQASSAAQFAADFDHPDAGAINLPLAQTTGHRNTAAAFYAGINLRKGAYTATIPDPMLTFAPPPAGTIEFYVLPRSPGIGSSVFDDNGEGLTELAWKRFDSTAANAIDLDYTSRVLGTTAAGPAYPATPAADGDDTSRGWGVVVTAAMFDAEGGFTYNRFS